MKRIVLLVAGLLASAAAQPQSWPERHVNVLAGYPAGSGVDIVARFVAAELRLRTGQAFVVDNRPGAGGNIAAQAAARAAPDGYTMLVTTNATHGINSSTYRYLGFDPVHDFTPVAGLMIQGFVLLVQPEAVPVTSVAELTAWIKARSGTASYASGNATGMVAAEIYRRRAGFDALHVPYKGVPAAVADLLGGRVHFLFADANTGLPVARSGRLRALAVTSATRMAAVPSLPTMIEAGIPDFDLYGWIAVFLPAGVPGGVVARLSGLCNEIMAGPEGRQFLARIAGDPMLGPPERLGTLVIHEITKWKALAATAGIEPQ